ncbi:BrnA antitoxin family protein [Variovorax sp. W1I1]|uniref:BrnA antitoxin family protein n=1 Tax=Variovorax sp. W1I1 TaxID=3042309 RepID=UPI0027D8A13E|nr:BrnA antitoxin family protein [Variovorax sp. W1I1]
MDHDPFDADLLDALKSGGRGWQTRVNDVIRSVFIPDTREEAVALARDLAKAPGERAKARSVRKSSVRSAKRFIADAPPGHLGQSPRLAPGPGRRRGQPHADQATAAPVSALSTRIERVTPAGRNGAQVAGEGACAPMFGMPNVRCARPRLATPQFLPGPRTPRAGATGQ